MQDKMVGAFRDGLDATAQPMAQFLADNMPDTEMAGTAFEVFRASLMLAVAAVETDGVMAVDTESMNGGADVE